jgi:hypothetical protein
MCFPEMWRADLELMISITWHLRPAVCPAAGKKPGSRNMLRGRGEAPGQVE